jgi:hypothetical protein
MSGPYQSQNDPGRRTPLIDSDYGVLAFPFTSAAGVVRIFVKSRERKT